MKGHTRAHAHTSREEEERERRIYGHADKQNITYRSPTHHQREREIKRNGDDIQIGRQTRIGRWMDTRTHTHTHTHTA